MSHCFQRLVETNYLWLYFLKACQSVSFENIRYLTFSFMTTTLDDVLDKNRYQHKTSSLRILTLTIEFDYTERC